ncbi:MAG TPA: glycosyltransferase [Candidatus Competibacteraceae bacterium]|nr:glycosyltransferase [Candidatus Competibacteraceae bacterium]
MSKVSVIMPTYNGERFIGRAIDSVLEQSMTGFELILIDDGSIDHTPELLSSYALKDCRIRVIRRETSSGGPTIPKNLALSLIMDSDYICFLDHDDYYHPNKLELMCAGLDKHPEWVAAFHDLQLVTTDGQFFDGTYLSNAGFLSAASKFLRSTAEEGWYDCGTDFYVFMSLRYAAMHTDSVIVAPLRLLKDPIGFRQRFRGSDDTDLWLRIGAQGSIGFLNLVLAYYRQHGNNLSFDLLAMNENAIEVHENNYLHARHFFSRKQLIQYRHKIASYQTNLGYQFYRQGRFFESRLAYTNAIRKGDIIQGFLGILKTYILQAINRGSPA